MAQRRGTGKVRCFEGNISRTGWGLITSNEDGENLVVTQNDILLGNPRYHPNLICRDAVEFARVTGKSTHDVTGLNESLITVNQGGACCFNCGKADHLQLYCPLRNQVVEPGPETFLPRTWFKCGMPGHNERECPNASSRRGPHPSEREGCWK